MRQLKRWTSSIATSFEWIVNQVENHSAVVASAIREMQESAAKARLQLKRVRQDGERLGKKLREAKEKEEAWRQRALENRESDRERAVECLKRMKQATRDVEIYTEEKKKHEALEKQLQSDLKTVNERIDQLKRKKNELSARQFRSDAMRVTEDYGISLVSEIDDMFDRWEVKIAQSEISAEEVDSFEEDFLIDEDKASLSSELDELQ